MFVAFLLLSILGLLVASDLEVVESPVTEYRHQDADFGYLVKRYLRRVLLPHVVNDDDDDDDEDDVIDKKVVTVYDKAYNPDDRHLRATTQSYFDATTSKWAGDDLSREPPDPDFWDIVAWIGTQIGRGIRALFDGLCKLSRAIYAGILYGWHSEDGVSGMNSTEIVPPMAP